VIVLLEIASTSRGRPVQPDDDWYRSAAEARSVAERESGAHVVLEAIYRDDNCRAALEELFSWQVCYCENRDRRRYLEVEHFRPKDGSPRELITRILLVGL